MNLIKIIEIIVLLGLPLGTTVMASSIVDVIQNPEQRFVDELVGRLGCDEASRWLAMPAAGAQAFQSTLKAMTADALAREGREDRANAWYSLSKNRLMDTKAIAQACNRHTPKKGLGEGLTELSALAPEGVTIFAIGGFGSHVSSEGALTTSLRAWQESHRGLFAEDKVRFARIECSFSYSSDETFCGEDALRQIKAFDAASPLPGKHRFLLWGYSKGGITAIEVLRRDPSVRARTLAIVTVGAPLRGAMVMDRMAPALDAYVNNTSIPGTMETMGADSVLKVLNLWIGGARADIDVIMKNFSKFRDGAHALTSKERDRILRAELSPGALARPNGSRIPVFQMAGLIDPRAMAALPVMTVINGKLVPKAGSYDSLHSAQLAALISSADHPLGDSCVALEQALLPVSGAIAAGLEPRFLGVARMDHISLRFHRSNNSFNHEVPDHAFVDATLSTIASGLKSGGHP
jgi:hypothetical protein